MKFFKQLGRKADQLNSESTSSNSMQMVELSSPPLELTPLVIQPLDYSHLLESLTTPPTELTRANLTQNLVLPNIPSLLSGESSKEALHYLDACTKEHLRKFDMHKYQASCNAIKREFRKAQQQEAAKRDLDRHQYEMYKQRLEQLASQAFELVSAGFLGYETICVDNAVALQIFANVLGKSEEELTADERAAIAEGFTRFKTIREAGGFDTTTASSSVAITDECQSASTSLSK